MFREDIDYLSTRHTTNSTTGTVMTDTYVYSWKHRWRQYIWRQYIWRPKEDDKNNKVTQQIYTKTLPNPCRQHADYLICYTTTIAQHVDNFNSNTLGLIASWLCHSKWVTLGEWFINIEWVIFGRAWYFCLINLMGNIALAINLIANITYCKYYLHHSFTILVWPF